MKLNRCQFCGNDRPRVVGVPYSVGPVLWFIECSCGHRGPHTYSESAATRAWNRIYLHPDDRVIEEMVVRQEVDFRTDKGA